METLHVGTERRVPWRCREPASQRSRVKGGDSYGRAGGDRMDLVAHQGDGVSFGLISCLQTEKVRCN